MMLYIIQRELTPFYIYSLGRGFLILVGKSELPLVHAGVHTYVHIMVYNNFDTLPCVQTIMLIMKHL
jgi:hypothetical protein